MCVCVCVYVCVSETLNSQQVSCQAPMDTVVECTTNKTFPLQSWYSNVVISNTVHDNGSSDYCNVY